MLCAGMMRAGAEGAGGRCGTGQGHRGQVVGEGEQGKGEERVGRYTSYGRGRVGAICSRHPAEAGGGGWGLKRPQGNQETVSESSQANAFTHLLTEYLPE